MNSYSPVSRVDEELHGARVDVADGRAKRRRPRTGGRALAGSRFGDGASSITFWWRRWTEQSRSKRCTMSPCASASTCTSMWRGRTIACSRYTERVAERAPPPRSSPSRRRRAAPARLGTSRMPRPPPPCAAFTKRGSRAPRRAAAAPGIVERLRRGQPGSPAVARRVAGADLVADPPQHLRRRAHERDARPPRRRRAKPRILGHEAVAGKMPSARTRRASPTMSVDVEVGLHGMAALADLVGLVGLHPVDRAAVVRRVDGHAPDAQLGIARKARMAISPRLATRTLRSTAADTERPGRAAGAAPGRRLGLACAARGVAGRRGATTKGGPDVPAGLRPGRRLAVPEHAASPPCRCSRCSSCSGG